MRIIILIAILCLTTPFINNHISNFLRLDKIDEISEEYLKDTLKKTSIAFLASRGVNALVSLAQSIETGGSLKFLGTGISSSLSPGEILDPLNDMVERFSWVMLASSVSIGIQLVLKNTLPWLCCKYLFPLSLMLLLFSIWTNRKIESLIYRTAIKFILVATLLILIIPVMAFTNNIICDYAFNEKYQSASKFIADQDVKSDTAKESMKDKIKKLKDKIGFLKELTSQYFKYLIDLLIVFVIQTMILPLLTMWIFLQFIRYIFNRAEPYQAEIYFKNKIFGRKIPNNINV